MNLHIGTKQEARALCFLKQKGLCFLSANYRARYAEIDLIFREGNTLVFVEVRYRTHNTWGNSLASVTRTKQKHLIRAALFFIKRHRQYRHFAVRFDVIGIDQSPDAPMQWIQNAFNADAVDFG